MFSRKLLLACATLGLFSNSLSAATDDSVQCIFSPHLVCSAQGNILWSKIDFDDPTPIVLNSDRVFISQSNSAYSYDARSGKQIWEIQSQNDARYFYPVVTGKHVYLARSDGNLEKRLHQTGELIWSKTLGSGWVYPPVTIDRKVITAGQDRTIWILDEQTGKPQTQITLDQELVTPLIQVAQQFIASTFDGKVSAYTLNRPTANWQTQLYAPVFSYDTDGENLITADMGGTLSAIDLKTGEIKWQQTVHHNALFWNLVQQQTLYSLSASGTLNILDVNSGKRRGRLEFAQQFAQAPIVQNDSIVLIDTKGSKQTVSFDELNGSQTNTSITLNSTRIDK